jgi:hypothetical protein
MDLRSEMGMRHVRRGGSGSPLLSRVAIEKAASIESGTTRPPAVLQPQPARMGKRSPTTVARDSSSMLRVWRLPQCCTDSLWTTGPRRQCTGPTGKILACSLCVQDIEDSRCLVRKSHSTIIQNTTAVGTATFYDMSCSVSRSCRRSRALRRITRSTSSTH